MTFDASLDITSEINFLGATISIYSKGTSTYNEWGDEISGTTSSTEAVAVVNDIDGNETWNEEGLFVPGDKVFFSTKSEDITEDNKDTYYIRFNSSDFKIMSVMQPPSGSVIQVKEMRCKRM